MTKDVPEDALALTRPELAERVGITLPNLSVLKNNRARGVRFTTLNAICRELDCQPGDILEYVEGEPDPKPDRSEVEP
ncbi:MAG: helix-turn-helix domain-containing protein [Longimicrobiales bacterium]